MKLIVFGATGGVGRQVLTQALAAGHEVTAFVRSPEKLGRLPGVRVVAGDAFDAEAVSAAIAAHDAVVSALGSSRGLSRSDELQRMTRSIVDGMAAHGVRRIAYCASAGIDGELPGVSGTAIQWMLRHPLADHRAAVGLIDAAGLDATIARPTGLNDDPLVTDYLEAFGGPPQTGRSIPRASVAHFLVKALGDPETYVGASVGLSTAK